MLGGLLLKGITYPSEIVPNINSFAKTVRSSTEPARIQLQQHILNEAPNLSADTVNDKYFIDWFNGSVFSLANSFFVI
jgi:hypothetical protein